ncbi:MAG: CvpA family protein [Peptostreptococcaceae bacterium]|nr:CvpA family protein [Peptostreptococcaceae bacterium]
MIIDIILFSILVVIMAISYRNGFISTFLHLVGWLISLSCGFFFAPRVKEYLISKDFFYTSINDKLLSKIPQGAPQGSFKSGGIPNLVGDFVDNVTNTVSTNIASSLTDLIMVIISFLIVVIAVKLFLYFITIIFSKRNRKGPTGLIDGLLGLAFGFFKGMIVLYIILAVMIPVINLTSPESTFTILTSLDSSVLAKDLYNNNPLLLITNLL